MLDFSPLTEQERAEIDQQVAKQEATALRALTNRWQSIEELAQTAGFSLATMSSHLALLELWDIVEFRRVGFSLEYRLTDCNQIATNWRLTKMFTDTEFMTAKEKEQALKAWERFLKGGCKFTQFTKALYHHLIQHCSFIAHYDRHGFYAYYFTDPAKTADFVGQFDSDKGNRSAEMGATYWLTSPEYGDINRAMCEVADKYKADIYANCRSEDFKRDMATVTALMAKHGLNNVQAVEGGYRFS